jgi:hypothetical protein
MITFRQHIDISRAIKRDDSLFGYIASLEASQKVEVTRGISESYPLINLPLETLSINKEFKYTVDIMQMVLGQFIMTEQIITGKTKYETPAENDLALAELILRPIHHKEFDNSNAEEESNNKEAILDSDVTEIYSVLQKYLEVRELVLFKQFAGVFYEVPEDEEEEEEQEKKSGEQLFQQQWYWYSMVRMLAKEDVTRYEDIYMLKMATVMPEMSFIAQRSKIDSARQRQSEAMSKL